jgi:uncharacterized cupin superfamily protein
LKIEIAGAPRNEGSSYPSPFDEPCRGRLRQRLGDAAGLTQFGVNLRRLAPGAWSSQRHYHSAEDEFVWVTNQGEEPLRAGDCAGFRAGMSDGHHLQNRSDRDVLILEVGTRNPEDVVDYPDIDLRATPHGGFTHKDGTPYPPRTSD